MATVLKRVGLEEPWGGRSSQGLGPAAEEPPRRRPVDREAAGEPEPLRRLAAEIRAIEVGGGRAASVVSSTGCGVLDAELPAGGLRGGSLVEWIGGAGDGSFTLALHAAREAMGEHRYAVLVDPRRRFYPPAAAAMGVDLRRLIVLHPGNAADALWSFDQALRCPAVAAVVGWHDRLGDVDARRLQLAAERGGGLGLLLRPAGRQAAEPSWAEISWQVTPLGAGGAGGPAGAGELGRPPGTRPYSDNYRWLYVRLRRVRAGHGGRELAARVAEGTAGFFVALEGHRGTLYAQRRWAAQRPARKSHESTSAVHLAAELAVPTRRRGDAADGRRGLAAG